MSGEAPPLRWALGEPHQRLAFRRYWVRDTLYGWNAVFWHFLLSRGSVDFCSWMGGGLGVMAGMFYPRRLDRARENFRRLRPDLDVEQAIHRLLENVGRALAEVAVAPRMWATRRVDLHGLEHMRAVHATGRPRIWLSLHIGNWELVGPQLLALNEDAVQIFAPQPNRFRRRMAEKIRAPFAARLVPPTPAGLRQAYRYVQKGGGLLLFVDEVVKGQVQAPSLGQGVGEKGNLALAVRMALQTGAVLIPVFATRTQAAQFDFRVHPHIELERTGHEARDHAAGLERIDALLREVALAHLDQWMMLPLLKLPD